MSKQGLHIENKRFEKTNNVAMLMARVTQMIHWHETFTCCKLIPLAVVFFQIKFLLREKNYMAVL